MKTIAAINQKGGVGKTTLAIHLATAFQLRKKNSIILDLDPQVSASEWFDIRAGELPLVKSIQPARLPVVKKEAEDIGTDLLMLDTPPHTESAILTAARAADLILIPCHPRIMDMRAMRKTVELLQYIDTPAFVVMNGAPSQGTATADAAQTISEDLNLKVAPVYLGNRVSFDRALIDGRSVQEYEPRGKAASEIQHLYEWTCIQLGMKKSRKVA